MWPRPDEVLAHTVLAERAIEGLYAEALRRWAPTAKAAALPTLSVTAAANNPANTISTQELPPDPQAVEQQQAAADWAVITEVVIIAGITVLYSAAVVEAMQGLGIALPDIDTAVDVAALVAIEAAVLRIVNQAVPDMGADELRHAAGIVDATPALREARDVVLSAQRERATTTPAFVAEKITAAVEAAEAGATVAEQRAAAADALDPAGEQLRKIAETAGHQAASVQNEATLAAAQQSEDADELESVWLATLDGKTRPTHWAAWGQRVPIGTAFTVGAASLMFPGDPTGPPEEVKNCRCRLGILAKDEPLPGEADAHTERLGGRDSVAINRDGRTQAEEIERRTAQGNTRARDNADGVGTVASGGWTAPSDQEYDMSKSVALAANTEQATDAETFLTFSGYIGKLGVPTSDRRILAADIKLSMREFPHPMAWQKQAVGGHYDSYTVGVVEESKIDGDRVWASGYFLNSPEAMEAADQVRHKVSAPSLDLAAAEYIFTDENGDKIEGDLFDWWEENGDPYTYFTEAEQTGFTLVQTPAFDGIDITIGPRETRDLAVVASVTELKIKTYDPELFSDPKLPGPTRPTMNQTTGRIYGHLAEWGHILRGGEDPVPHNYNGYANFHTSQVMLDNGKQLSVGRLTVQGGHAPTTPGLSVATARAHYDNVCTAFGLVRVGEDAHGIWFSGVPAPGVDPETFQQGMTAPLSGDWRDAGRGLDMIAAHSVNSPGFPIYSAATGPDGREVALVASLGPSRKSPKASGGMNLDVETLAAVITEVVDAVDQRNARRQAEIALAAEREAVLAQAQELVGEPPAPKSPNEEIAELLAAGTV